MTLHELIAALPRTALTGPEGGEVGGLHDDSRRVGPGDVFVAVRGDAVDGHEFIGAAVEAGAAAIIAEDPARSDLPEGLAWILVPDSREALGILSALWHGHPSQDLRVAGVTGTNGKTTTTFLLYCITIQTGRWRHP